MQEEQTEKMYSGIEIILMIGLQVFGMGLLVMLAIFIMFIGFGENADLTVAVPLLAMLHLAAVICVVTSMGIMLKATWSVSAVYFSLGVLFAAGLGGAGYCWRHWIPLGLLCAAAAFFAGLASLADQGGDTAGSSGAGESVGVRVAENNEDGE
jgi:hypothetical protein